MCGSPKRNSDKMQNLKDPETIPTFETVRHSCNTAMISIKRISEHDVRPYDTASLQRKHIFIHIQEYERKN